MSVEPRKIKKIIRNLQDTVEARKEAFPDIPAKKPRRAEKHEKKLEKPAPREVKPAGSSTPRTVEGMVTLSQLALERNIQAQLARLWVKKAGMQKPTAGWQWKEGSRDLARARKALGLPA